MASKREALLKCLNAMKMAQDVGCVDHLDCCEDGGKFWYDAIRNAEEVLKEDDDRYEGWFI